MLPFRRTTTNALSVSAVRRLVREQMETSRTDPASALRLLEQAHLPSVRNGFDADDVRAWINDQREWLESRLAEPTVAEISPVSAACSALEGALTEITGTIRLEVSSAQREAADLAADAELRCRSIVSQAEKALAAKLEQALRRANLEAARILEEANRDARNTLQEAGALAAKLMLDAEQQRQRAHAELTRATDVQTQLLQAIDAASTAVSPPVQNAA